MDNVQNHPVATSNFPIVKTPDLATRVHFFVIRRLGLVPPQSNDFIPLQRFGEQHQSVIFVV